MRGGTRERKGIFSGKGSPAAVQTWIKFSTLDSRGCCLFGTTLPWTRKLAALVAGEGRTRSHC